MTCVRFLKEMRLVSLEIPEPDATGYQNLVRQNPKLTRSDATRFRSRWLRLGMGSAVTSLTTCPAPLPDKNRILLENTP